MGRDHGNIRNAFIDSRDNSVIDTRGITLFVQKPFGVKKRWRTVLLGSRDETNYELGVYSNLQ